jgi:hypothetical protein
VPRNAATSVHTIIDLAKWIVTLAGSGCADEGFRVHVPEDNAVADRYDQETGDVHRRPDCRAVILNQIAI